MTLWCLLALVVSTSNTDAAAYATTVRTSLSGAAPKWLQASKVRLKPALKDNGRAMALGLELSGTGAAAAERLVQPSGDATLDDLGRTFVLSAEPFAPPPPSLLDERGQLTCVVRLALTSPRGKTSVDVAVGCLAPDDPVGGVAGLSPETSQASDAGARLLSGWSKEAAGDLPGALALYQQAAQALSTWDLAARAVGMALVKSNQVKEAVPHLKRYLEAHTAAADVQKIQASIERFEKLEAAQAADAVRVRVRLSPQDIAKGVRKGYPLLEPCLERARTARLLAVGVDTLQLSWKVTNDGSVAVPRLDGPESLLLTEHAECIERAISAWRFARFSEGTETPVRRVPIKVRGSAPPVAATTSAAATPPSVDNIPDEPTFSQCERSSDEVGAYIRQHLSRLHACIAAERRRAPTVKLPDTLPMAFVIDAEGPVRNVSLLHRAYRDGPLARCMGEALTGQMEPRGGSDCPAEFGLDLR